jgi:hypothetical protein
MQTRKQKKEVNVSKEVNTIENGIEIEVNDPMTVHNIFNSIDNIPSAFHDAMFNRHFLVGNIPQISYRMCLDASNGNVIRCFNLWNATYNAYKVEYVLTSNELLVSFKGDLRTPYLRFQNNAEVNIDLIASTRKFCWSNYTLRDIITQIHHCLPDSYQNIPPINRLYFELAFFLLINM